VDIDIVSEQVAQGVAVRVRLALTPRETNQLYLSGDTLIQLPTEGAMPESEAVPFVRPSMFLSELAGTRDGLTRIFTDATAAERYAAAVRSQLETVMEGT
jgi:hypothetical protein